MNEAAQQSGERTYTVSQLNEAVNRLLKKTFGVVRVTGEISDCTMAASGHIYFSLKDAGGAVSCALFRGKARYVKFKLENGMQVDATASVEVYKERGRYQLIISTLSPVGEGLLLQQIEEVKKLLLAEGVFDTAHKKNIPPLPNVIGILTSTGGAVLHDITRTLKKHYPLGEIVVYPVIVQGGDAPRSICTALEAANRDKRADVLILARGGGSLQDLMAFNDEAVARAIFASELPVVTGIGHEPDHSIADMVADRREATPTAAAQAVAKNQLPLLQENAHCMSALLNAMENIIAHKYTELKSLRVVLAARSPASRVQSAMQRLDDYVARLVSLVQHQLGRGHRELAEQNTALRYLSPRERVRKERESLNRYYDTLMSLVAQKVKSHRLNVNQLRERVTLLNPSNVLKRGYAIVSDAGGKTISSSRAVKARDAINIQLHRGKLRAEVTKVTKPDTSK